jgi:hypothetical protein
MSDNSGINNATPVFPRLTIFLGHRHLTSEAGRHITGWLTGNLAPPRFMPIEPGVMIHILTVFVMIPNTPIPTAIFNGPPCTTLLRQEAPYHE